MNIRILVTGGAGFIGSHLCLALQTQRHEVAAIDAFRSDAWRAKGATRAPLVQARLAMLSDICVHHIDLLDRGALAAMLEGFRPECIIHLASEALVSAAQYQLPESSLDIVQSTANLIDAVRGLGGVRRFVCVSSSMVYGHAVGDSVPEDAPLAPVNAYGLLKRAAEELTRNCLANTGIETVVVRPTGVYGALDFHNRVISAFCGRALAGELLTVNSGPDAVVDFTYIDDLVRGLVLTCLHPKAAGETFNLSYGEARRVEEVAEIIRLHIPRLEVVLVQQVERDRPCRAALDITKARRLLGYSPSWPLDRGVARCLKMLVSLAATNASARTHAAERTAA